VSLQELRGFVFEDALPNKCYPQVPLSLGQSKNTRLSKSSCFPIQLLCANMLSHNYRRMTKPGEDRLFLQAAPNRDTAINLPNNNRSAMHKKRKSILEDALSDLWNVCMMTLKAKISE